MKIYKKETRRNQNHLVRWTIILTLLIAASFFVYLLVKIGQPLVTEAEGRVFSVAEGSSGKQISQELYNQDFITSSLIFDLYVFVKGYSGKIQAGEYLVSSNMSIREIAKKLVSGEAITDSITMTVIEGWSISEIAAEVQDLGVASQSEFISVVGQPRVGGSDDFTDEFDFLASVPKGSSLEGFLFPDTYFIDSDAEAEDVVRKILQNFDRKVTEKLRGMSEASGRTLYENIILASIVEREVGRNVKKGTALSDKDKAKIFKERRIVAGVFLNRLEIGMALESDATVGYITGSGSARATIAQTQINSPYNTYRNPGLPPGPISNPSLDSIITAIDPEESDYLFFLTSPDGTAYFAENLEGHQRNRNLYLE